MAKEDKFAGEMLTDEELDGVVGGTRAETQELIKAVYKKVYNLDISGIDLSAADVNVYLKSELEAELASFGVNSKVDVGFKGTGIGEKANEYYTPKGNKISHEQLMNIFNK
mgnify:CR=1 FL=1